MNTTYWLNKIMDTMYVSSSNEFWLGLSSTEPTKLGGSVSEPSGNGYTRMKITSFSAPEDGVILNTENIEFPRSTGVWFESTAKAQYWVLFDGNGTGAKLLSSGKLDEAKTVESNTKITVAAETLSITLTDYLPETEY